MSLTVIRGPRAHRQHLVYDLEWIPGTLEVRCVGVYDGNQYRCYSSVQAFMDNEFTHKNRGKWFYAHAGGLADAQFIIHDICKTLKTKGYQVNAAFSGSSAIIVKCARGHNTWILVDSYWLLRDKLSEIAKWLGTSKGKGSYDRLLDPDEAFISDDEYESRRLAKREWYATVSFQELRQYNEQDCVILWRAIYELQLTILELGGQMQMTMASTAMQLFRRKYLTLDIETNSSINFYARQAYTASRVEVLKREVKNSYYFDVNSSFPYAMTYPCPGNYLGCGTTLPDDGIYIAKVLVDIPDTFLPSVPLRMRGRVFFPTGTIESWLTSVDIQLLQREGAKILKVYEVLHFEEFSDLRAYALDIYKLRKKATSAFEKVAYKLFLNSLYGKFAESDHKQSLVIDPDTIDATSMEMVMPGVWLKEKIVPVPHMHVPIAAHITAIARRTLYDYMAQVREVHYCDTDGFSATDSLPVGEELGDLKLEKIVSSGHFEAPKFYNMRGYEQAKDGLWKPIDNYKAKGMPRISASRFAALLEGESIEYERMYRLRENLRAHCSQPREYTIAKRMRVRGLFDPRFNPAKNPVPKRMTYPDGHTRPWRVEELKDLLAA